jgi:aldose 1-epimerase
MIGEREVEGYEALTLASPAGLEAAFVPAAGMVGCSLRHHGDELLGQRGGLRTYTEEHSTMGIPLLHPWANRLARTQFSVAGREVDLDSPALPISNDPNGLPIHGLLAGAGGWRVERHEASAAGGVLNAAFDFGVDPTLVAAFPFPHRLSIEASLAGAELTIATTVAASGGAPVPISFGYHPYFRLPGVERADWEVEAPVAERLELDHEMIPTGAREAVRIEAGPLGARTFDDAYLAPPGAKPFALAGGGRRIEVSFAEGFPYAQVYAPDDDDVVALEPMTAPTNALVSGTGLRVLEPGEEHRATFSVTVTDVGA